MDVTWCTSRHRDRDRGTLYAGKHDESSIFVGILLTTCYLGLYAMHAYNIADKQQTVHDMNATSIAGKIVAVMAKDHSSSINIDKDDLDRIKKNTAQLIAIGLVIDDDDEKILLGSFFTCFQGVNRHYEVHSILKKEIVEIDLLEKESVIEF
jgi:hypothetical protein